jgi:hypothetical protein
MTKSGRTHEPRAEGNNPSDTHSARPKILDGDRLDALTQTPNQFECLVEEDEESCVLELIVTEQTDGLAAQRVLPHWPHHLPGETVIALTGQAACILLRRRGIIDEGWRGHGVRIRDARYSASVGLGEIAWMRVELGRVRRLRGSLHVQFRFRMWKRGASGDEVETFRSEQDAIFFPGQERASPG